MEVYTHLTTVILTSRKTEMENRPFKYNQSEKWERVETSSRSKTFALDGTGIDDW